ncbi:hypothetical protein [Bradyrhizobium commune]|uniref:Uncharacterized protein n=1 Tax=Bradyrhizobium commune TaxID=83627 RepID=A0A7S9D6Q8_9BRAD|nr:hypothetical protein [Bradyrhizobium commune]QPF91474.1 hypothetical protein IC761_34405 [Bradyrhizobium commune]
MVRPFIYKNAELEMDRLGKQHGWVPTAKTEAVDHHAKFFQLIGNELLHTETGDTIEEWAAKQKTERPHWYLPDEVVDNVDVCFGGGPKSRVNIDARMKLFKEVGDVNYNNMMAQWGATPTRNGERPLPESRETVERAKQDKTAADNPWSASGWNITSQGRLVKALGLETAQGIAKAAGSFVGATRPAR